MGTEANFLYRRFSTHRAITAWQERRDSLLQNLTPLAWIAYSLEMRK